MLGRHRKARAQKAKAAAKAAAKLRPKSSDRVAQCCWIGDRACAQLGREKGERVLLIVLYATMALSMVGKMI